MYESSQICGLSIVTLSCTNEKRVPPGGVTVGLQVRTQILKSHKLHY